MDGASAFVYNGEGQRVRKLVGENTRFVYGIGGQLIAEFDGSTGNLKKEYVSGGATLITIEPSAVNSNGTQYTTMDHLGSPRVITSSSAGVVSRHDFLPFGEELGSGVGGRTTAMGFSNSGDTNRKKFTGYERDAETGLDFALARYYSSTQGRFTSPDTLLGAITNPQTLNRYAYVGNNPLTFSDPTGHTRFIPASENGFSEMSSDEGGGYMYPDPVGATSLPERYEAEIKRIKELIAEDEEAASNSTPAPEHAHESAPEHAEDNIDEPAEHADSTSTGGVDENAADSQNTTMSVSAPAAVVFTTAQIYKGDAGTFANEGGGQATRLIATTGQCNPNSNFTLTVNYSPPDSTKEIYSVTAKGFGNTSVSNWYVDPNTINNNYNLSNSPRTGTVSMTVNNKNGGRSGSPPYDAVQVIVKGNYKSGQGFSTPAMVHIQCP